MTHPVLVLADIHGNLNALNAVLKDASGKYGEIWVLGDIMGYGPDPEKCLNLLQDRRAVIIAGNHDLAACGKIDIENFNDEARAALKLHKACLSERQKNILKELPYTLKMRSVTLSHGNPEDPVWGYVHNREKAGQVLIKAQTSLTLVGHTHIPGLYAFNNESGSHSISFRYGEEMDYSGVPYLANPGSVGQSRDGDISARYMILIPEKKIIIFKKCLWKTGPVRKKMIAAGYPQSLIDRMAPKKPLSNPGSQSSSSR